MSRAPTRGWRVAAASSRPPSPPRDRRAPPSPRRWRAARHRRERPGGVRDGPRRERVRSRRRAAATHVPRRCANRASLRVPESASRSAREARAFSATTLSIPAATSGDAAQARVLEPVERARRGVRGLGRILTHGPPLLVRHRPLRRPVRLAEARPCRRAITRRPRRRLIFLRPPPPGDPARRGGARRSRGEGRRTRARPRGTRGRRSRRASRRRARSSRVPSSSPRRRSRSAGQLAGALPGGAALLAELRRALIASLRAARIQSVSEEAPPPGDRAAREASESLEFGVRRE